MAAPIQNSTGSFLKNPIVILEVSVPKALMAFGTRVLKYWVLGPSG